MIDGIHSLPDSSTAEVLLCTPCPHSLDLYGPQLRLELKSIVRNAVFYKTTLDPEECVNSVGTTEGRSIQPWAFKTLLAETA